MYYLFEIYNENDFDNLRNFKFERCTSKNVVININEDITFKNSFKPINLEGFDVIVNGNNHTLSNINIDTFTRDYFEKDFAAMFSNLYNLYVYNLNINNSNVYGAVKCGTLAGHIDGNAIINNVNATNLLVNSEAFAGGLIGRCNEIELINSNISSSVYGHDVVGGVVGMANKYTEENSSVECDGMSILKAIDERAGYCELKFIKRK